MFYAKPHDRPGKSELVSELKGRGTHKKGLISTFTVFFFYWVWSFSPMIMINFNSDLELNICIALKRLHSQLQVRRESLATFWSLMKVLYRIRHWREPKRTALEMHPIWRQIFHFKDFFPQPVVEHSHSLASGLKITGSISDNYANTPHKRFHSLFPSQCGQTP